MSWRALRGVIFDMDGVLIDSHPAHRKAWRIFLQTVGREVSEPALDFILDGRKRSDILRHFLGELPDSELEELGRRKDCIFRQLQLEIAPVPGAVGLVEELHRSGIALALATCASGSRAQSTLSSLRLADYFHVIVTGEDVSFGKPDAAIYRLACTRLQIAPRYLLAIEDAASGVQSAVSAGLSCLGVAWHETGEKLTAAGAIEVVEDFQRVSVCDLENVLSTREPELRPAAAAGN